MRESPIVRVEAEDADSFGLASHVTFTIEKDHDGKLFEIDEKTGDIYSLQTLDRELKVNNALRSERTMMKMVSG